MNKKTTILLHAASWLAILCAPLMYIDRSTTFDVLRYLFFCMAPALLMVVFYANYLWLVPKYYIKGNRLHFSIMNICMMITLAVFLHLWMDFGHTIFPLPHRLHKNFDNGEDEKAIIFAIRDIFNMTIAAAMATMMRLAENWHKSELARQEAEKERTKAELSNLRSQIKPHFMLNTLNNIYTLTSFSPERARKAIEQLSSLLRHILYENEKPEISINEEVEFIGDYIALMKLRVANNVDIQYDTNIPEGCFAKIAPMILISLVENAFKHGVSPTNPSFIHINIIADDNHIDCTIKNSNYPKLANDKSGHGIGLVQVSKRLELNYQNQYEWFKGISDDGKVYTSQIIIYLRRNLFTTAFPQYAIDGYEVEALGYILKPVSYDAFLKVAKRAHDWFIQSEKAKNYAEDRFIYVKSDYKLVRIDLDDILFIEGLKDYVRIYTENGEKTMSLMNMKMLEDFLPKPDFLRSHRSYIVHMNKVRSLDRLRLIVGENYIPVSESYKDTILM